MKRTESRLLLIVGLMCFLKTMLFVTGSSQTPPTRTASEAHYLHIGAYPSGAVSWGEGTTEAQGITHDAANWYITASVRGFLSSDITNAILWKIPVRVNLNGNANLNPHTTMYSYPQLWNGSDPRTGYIHWGDLDHYKFNGTDFLAVPMTSGIARTPNLDWGDPAVVIIRASDLSLVGYGLLPGSNNHGQKDVGWLAIDSSSGHLYTSEDSTTTLFHYTIPWANFPPASAYIGEFPVTRVGSPIPLKDATVDTALDLHNMAGGEFSPSGELLYISNGGGCCEVGPFGGGQADAGWVTDGIHVFDTRSWKEIKHSTNRFYYDCPTCGSCRASDCCRPLNYYFDYTYDFSCGTFESHSSHPQGLTLWDLDNEAAPGVSGQLHVITGLVGAGGNEARLDHFSGRLHVNAVTGSPPTWTEPLPGSLARPFLTFGDAFNWYPAWDGSEIVLSAGTYSGVGTYDRRVRIVSRGGSAVVGP